MSARRLQSRAATLFAVALLVALAGCQTRASGKKLAEKLEASLEEKLGAVNEIRCPDQVLIERQGTVFECQVALERGFDVSIEVKLDRAGGLGWHTR